MVISQRHSTKKLTGLQNKTKHLTTENKRINEIVGSYEIILLWSVMNMVCYESGLFRMGTILNSSHSKQTIYITEHCYVFMSHDFQTVDYN